MAIQLQNGTAYPNPSYIQVMFDPVALACNPDVLDVSESDNGTVTGQTSNISNGWHEEGCR